MNSHTNPGQAVSPSALSSPSDTDYSERSLTSASQAASSGSFSSFASPSLSGSSYNNLTSPSAISASASATPHLLPSRKLIFPATHNKIPVTDSYIKKAEAPQAQDLFTVIRDIPLGELTSLKSAARTRICQSLAHAIQNVSQACVIEDIIIVTDFNIGYSGIDLLSVDLLKQDINTFATQQNKSALQSKLISVNTQMEYQLAKAQHKIPVLFFLQGSGGIALTIESFDSIRVNHDPSLSFEKHAIKPSDIQKHNFCGMDIKNYFYQIGVPGTPNPDKARKLSRAGSSTPNSLLTPNASTTPGSANSASLKGTDSPHFNFPISSPPAPALSRLQIPSYQLPTSSILEAIEPKTPIDKKITKFKQASPSKGLPVEEDAPPPHDSPSIVIEPAADREQPLNEAIAFSELDIRYSKLTPHFQLDKSLMQMKRHHRDASLTSPKPMHANTTLYELTEKLNHIDLGPAHIQPASTPASPASSSYLAELPPNTSTPVLNRSTSRLLRSPVTPIIVPYNSPFAPKVTGTSPSFFHAQRELFPEEENKESSSTPTSGARSPTHN